MAPVDKEALDKLLVEFLQDARTDRKQIREQVAGQHKATSHISNQITLLANNMDLGFKEVKNEFKGIYSRLEKLEEDFEDTGRHNVEDLRRKLHEKETEEKERANYWKKELITWSFRVAAFAGGGVVTYLVSLIVSHK